MASDARIAYAADMVHSPTTKRASDTVVSRLVSVYDAERVTLFGFSVNGSRRARNLFTRAAGRNPLSGNRLPRNLFT